MTDDLVAGLVVDAAAKLATLVPQRAPTVEAALAYLEATGDTTVADHLADRGGPGALPPDVAARIDLLAGAWPAIDPGVVAAGRGAGAGRAGRRCGRGERPARRPARRPADRRGRPWSSRSRPGAGTTAPAPTPTSTPCSSPCATGGPPAAVVTVVADGTTQVEPVRPAVLTTAADRVVHAVEVAAAIAAGEPAPAHPGPHCGHCPLRAACPEGRPGGPTTPPAVAGTEHG